MNLTAGVLTNLERPDLFTATLRSLAAAGLGCPHVCVDLERRGQANAFLPALSRLLAVAATQGWVLLAEDDIAVPVGFGPYLETICGRLHPHRDRLGFATLFCSVGYAGWVAAHPVPGVPCFGRLLPNDRFSGNQCLLFPADSLARLLPGMARCLAESPDWGGDRILGRAAELEQLEAWCHVPSLVDHRGLHRTTVGSRSDDLAIIAANYPGDAWKR